MFNLKEQLLAAGLVTDKPPNQLNGLPKAEQYELIRLWVTRNRLDKGIGTEKFFFEKADKSISWLTLEPNIIAKLQSGEAGLIAFMSHNGLAHAVVPRDIAEDIVEIFPDWLRVLK